MLSKVYIYSFERVSAYSWICQNYVLCADPGTSGKRKRKRNKINDERSDTKWQRTPRPRRPKFKISAGRSSVKCISTLFFLPSKTPQLLNSLAFHLILISKLAVFTGSCWRPLSRLTQYKHCKTSQINARWKQSLLLTVLPQETSYWHFGLFLALVEVC